MTIICTVAEGATQAKLTIKYGNALIKIPSYLSEEGRISLRNKLIKIADDNAKTTEFLKLYYKLGTPYLFLNKKMSDSKKVTIKVYTYNEL